MATGVGVLPADPGKGGHIRRKPMTDTRQRGAWRRAGFACLLVLGLLGCEAPPDEPFRGYLFFPSGKYLGQLSLASGEATPVANFGEQRVEHVSALDNQELLLSVFKPGGGRGRYRVLRFHPIRLSSSTLLVGRQAHYLAPSGVIVYDSGTALQAVQRRNVRRSPTLLQADSWQHPAELVSLGEAGLLFQSAGELIQHFDPDTGEYRALGGLSAACRLGDAVWLADHTRLACRSPEDQEDSAPYRLASLNGDIDGSLSLPAGRRFRAVTYIPDQRILILNETRVRWFSKSERYPVWAYDVATGRLRAVADNQYLGATAVYRRSLR